MVINVARLAQPNMIVGESPVFKRKKGKEVLTGFSFNFSQGLNEVNRRQSRELRSRCRGHREGQEKAGSCSPPAHEFHCLL